MVLTKRRYRLLVLFLLTVQLVSATVSAAGYSKTRLYTTGYYSSTGYCGTTADHYGKGYQSTHDLKLKYNKSNPCKGNACYSKFGHYGLGPDCKYTTASYCGTTKDFCGKKTVNRPSCSAKGTPMRRVVGCYEGWASSRSCDNFSPSDIPDRVYTHINFAFASINPKTLKSSQHLIDPELKVFIAIGGWAFNDPSPTVTTFSDIARSETNQRTFIKSLVSFMATYGFDGVDIDWDSRRIIADSSFPGAWDTPKSWLGNHLNSHANLTEIKDAFDLLWRNKIDPDQVNMGLAFYACIFSVYNTGCMSPGCLFDAGGPKEPCTNAVGAMYNPEIMRKLGGKIGLGDLDKTAAVKTLKFGRTWLTYDDVEVWAPVTSEQDLDENDGFRRHFQEY
ncbi:class V chitinase [Fusarium sp. NRRL 52700]|nr:class V chitinase [Fusarium sp. NRRL 52700]